MYTLAKCTVAAVDYCFSSNKQDKFSQALDRRRERCGGEESCCRVTDRCISGIAGSALGAGCCITGVSVCGLGDTALRGVSTLAPLLCFQYSFLSCIEPRADQHASCISEGIALESLACKDTFCPTLCGRVHTRVYASD